MVLWIGFAVLAAAVVWAVTRPLLTAPDDSPQEQDRELTVYKDQLAELEAERAQGLIAVEDADAARTELARRVLQRAERKHESAAPDLADETLTLRRIAFISAAALPVIAIGVYLAIGSPGLPGRPYAARLNAPVNKSSMGDMVAKVEAHLRNHPEDGKGWDVIAPVYMRMGNFGQAADAYERANRLLGESPKRLAGFARATIFIENGIVTEPARRAYEKLLAGDPDALEAQAWLAIAKEQDGDLAGAATDYRTLLDGAGAEPPWRALLEERLQAATARLQEAPRSGGPEAEGVDKPSVPSTRDQANFHKMTPEQREQFIQSMVDGLASRLKEDGKDLNGWMKLVRAYVVLGRKQEATSALADARSIFAGDEKSLGQLNALAQVLGLGS